MTTTDAWLKRKKKAVLHVSETHIKSVKGHERPIYMFSFKRSLL